MKVKTINSVPSITRFSRNHRFALLTISVLMIGGGAVLAVAENSNRFVPRFQEFVDRDGRFANFNEGGATDTTKNAFFQDLGTNDGRYVTCDQVSDAWSVTPPN